MVGKGGMRRKGTKSPKRSKSPVYVRGVKVGTRTYYGKAIVEGTGMTSDQVKRAIRSGKTITIEQPQQTIQSQLPQSKKPIKPAVEPGVISRAPRPKGFLERQKARLDVKAGILRTQKLRSSKGGLTPLQEAKLMALRVPRRVLETAIGLKQTPKAIVGVVKEPKKILQIPKAISQSGAEFGETLRTSPGEALVQVGTDIVILKGSSSALKNVSKLSTKGFTKLSPKYVGELKADETLTIKTGGGKIAKLKVVKRIPTESYASQVGRAGTRATAISSQADTLVGLIKRKKLLRKPIPGEAEFTSQTKKLLTKFDSGKISKAELVKLDALIKKQGAKGLLERTFFADPSGKIRPSRLGMADEQPFTFKDYISEDISFKKQKPQILLFEDIKISKFPKRLEKIANKVKNNKQLTLRESNKLLEWQLKKSGKFKPLGFVTKESEITLAPGEIIKRGKKVGVTMVDGKRIPIIKTEILKPTGKLKTLINKYQAGKLTKAQERNLDRLLKKKTGFDYGISSSKKISAKYINPKRTILSASPLVPRTKKKITTGVKKIETRLSKKQSSKPTSRKPLSRKPLSKKSLSSKKSGPKPLATTYLSKGKPKPSKVKLSKTYRKPLSKRPSSPYKPSKPYKPTGPSKPKTYKPGYTPKYPGKATPKYPPKYPPKILTKDKKIPVVVAKASLKKKKLSKAGKNIGYNVYEKRAGRFIKVKGKPLNLKDARDRLAFRLDNRISRTAKLVQTKTNRLGRIGEREKGYFSKYRKNLRDYKIVNGKRVKMQNTFIEKKGKGVISTRGEKRQLKLNRELKSKSKRKR